VLEHVEDVELALDRIQSVVRPGGVQRHVCPNYAFPHESHFFSPLVPVKPAATRRFSPRPMTSTGLWAPLNFATARQVGRWARRSGAEVRFDRVVLAEALDRLVSDAVLAKRHRHLVTLVRLPKRFRVIELVRRLPAGFSSSMRFTVQKASAAP
jgi:hypothetical protein